MMGVTRRGFLGALTALVAAPVLPLSPPLAFNPDTFALTGPLSLPLTWSLLPARVGETISVRLPPRFTTSWDSTEPLVYRFTDDVTSEGR